jgi:hypothetical protein
MRAKRWPSPCSPVGLLGVVLESQMTLQVLASGERWRGSGKEVKKDQVPPGSHGQLVLFLLGNHAFLAERFLYEKKVPWVVFKVSKADFSSDLT